ncbi:MAG: 2-amino-4-hydroxy-6-hydroxymethyldihydropteridine diphosphokinase [Bryobacteraceae bacterium]
MPLKRVYLSLGSNVGEREENLNRALRALERDNIHLLAQSSVYETEPQDVVQQRWFLNLAVECETLYFPLQMLGAIQRIERELGRERGAGAVRGGPRVIDIDILLLGSVVMATRQLTIPHPRMLERRFVLEPLLEIAPELRHPGTREPLSKYLGKLEGQKVRRH